MNFFRLLFKWKYSQVLKADSVEDRFTGIYKKNIWFGNKESMSGSGSTLTATQTLREQLPVICEKLNVQTLVDLGCGDYHWMKEIALPSAYHGVDVVEYLMDRNRELYASDKISFSHGNIIEGEFPQGELYLCREVMFHLSIEDNLKFIENLKKRKGAYFMATSNGNVEKNTDIRSGEFRNIDLTKAPFNFPEPLETIKDDSLSETRFLGIWKIDEIGKNKAQ